MTLCSTTIACNCRAVFEVFPTSGYDFFPGQTLCFASSSPAACSFIALSCPQRDSCGYRHNSNAVLSPSYSLLPENLWISPLASSRFICGPIFVEKPTFRQAPIGKFSLLFRNIMAALMLEPNPEIRKQHRSESSRSGFWVLLSDVKSGQMGCIRVCMTRFTAASFL